MQPYFYPYMGYFDLFKLIDTFVIFDCVQFIRRGYIHRNQFYLENGALDWLSLPLIKAPQTTPISEIQLHKNFEFEFATRSYRFPIFSKVTELAGSEVIFQGRDDLTSYLISNLKFACNLLSLQKPMVRSSTLKIDSSLKGEDRILEICAKMKATKYVNLTGGRGLYCEKKFLEKGVQLEFTNPYAGARISMLEEICN